MAKAHFPTVEACAKAERVPVYLDPGRTIEDGQLIGYAKAAPRRQSKSPVGIEQIPASEGLIKIPGMDVEKKALNTDYLPPRPPSHREQVFFPVGQMQHQPEGFPKGARQNLAQAVGQQPADQLASGVMPVTQPNFAETVVQQPHPATQQAVPTNGMANRNRVKVTFHVQDVLDGEAYYDDVVVEDTLIALISRANDATQSFVPTHLGDGVTMMIQIGDEPVAYNVAVPGINFQRAGESYAVLLILGRYPMDLKEE